MCICCWTLKATHQDLVTKRSSKNVYFVFDSKASHQDLVTNRLSKNVYVVSAAKLSTYAAIKNETDIVSHNVSF